MSNRVANNRMNEAPIGLFDGGTGNTFQKNTILQTRFPGRVAP